MRRNSADDGAFVFGHREGGEDGDDAEGPGDGSPDVVAGGGAEEEGAHRVDDDREGLTSAKACRAAGIDSTGTKAEEMKVRGKMTMKPSDWAASGEVAVRPTKAKTQEKA